MGVADALIGFQVHFLVFHTAPQPLDEEILTSEPPLSSMLLEHVDKLLAAKPAALVGVDPKKIS
jgi:hypothetical protein